MDFTFEEKLIREVRPEPLEGHTVVVLERVGEAGEKFRMLLEPGAPPPRKGLFSVMLGRPNPFFAFAVDATRGRPCLFSEHVQMVEQAHGFHLQFTLWYRVSDARLLVSARMLDPLGQVRRKVAQVVIKDAANLTWAEVSQSFRAAGEMVVDRTLPELQAFARDYGIQVLSLHLRARLSAASRQTDIDVHAVREPEQLNAMKAARLRNIRNDLRRENAGRDDQDRVENARRALEETLTSAPHKVGELIAQTGSVSELHEVHAGLAEVHSALEAVRTGLESHADPADTLYRVWYATNRTPRKPETEAGYGARLDATVHYGTCNVIIPGSHRIGELGSPWYLRFLHRTDDRIKVSEIIPSSPVRFWRNLRRCADDSPEAERQALVFIHGYRVSFRDAAIRAAQLGYDLRIRGPVGFFSWPSRATLLGYGADSASVEASEAAITTFLTDFVRNCGTDRVHVIAHSMGNRPFLRALQRILAAPDREKEVPFYHIVLAAPDITRELFLDVAEQYRRLSRRTTLYISDEDRALRASFRVQGPRVGLAPPVTCADGIDTIHVANVDRTFLGHSTFAEARPILTDIHQILNFDAPPDRRHGLVERTNGTERYWEVHA